VTAVLAVLAVVFAVQYALIATLWVTGSAAAVAGNPPFPSGRVFLGIVLAPLAIAVWWFWRALRTARRADDRWTRPVVGKSLLGAGLVVLAVDQTTLGIGCQLIARGPIPDPTFSLSVGWSDGAALFPDPAPVLAYGPGGPCGVSIDLLPIVVGVALLAVGLWYDDWLDATLAGLVAAVDAQFEGR
jgi:hypothetical protein